MKRGRKEMFKNFKGAMSIDDTNKGGDEKSHVIKYGKCEDTNRT